MTTNLRLPPAEKTNLRIGFMRLTDSAPLIIAKELGFFAKVGLDVQLVRNDDGPSRETVESLRPVGGGSV